MRKLVLAVSALTLTVPALPTAAAAHDNGYRGYTVYCKKRSGTTGTLVGGAAGAIAGRQIDKNGSRATGTILGAALGDLAGRHVERNVIRARCR